MALSDIVNVAITTESAAVTQLGFGTPLILASDCPAGFTERVRVYTALKGLSDDGFSTTGATYLMAARVFAQTPRVQRLKVGRVVNKPTLRWAITPTVANSTVYTMKVNGQTATFTSGLAATVTNVIAGLKAAIDALALPVTVSDQTTFMRIVSNTAGAWNTVACADIALLGLAQDQADPGVAADLAAIISESDDFYGVLSPSCSAPYVLALGTAVEATTKMYLFQCQDSAAALLNKAGDLTSAGYVVAALARTMWLYSESGENFADAGETGRCLPLDPGSETWAFKTLAGVPPSNLTATRKANILGKAGNTYTVVAGIAITENGKVAAGEYADVVRFRDWLTARMAESIFGALARAKKIPFTDGGISVIEGLVRAALAAGVAAGGLAANPAPVVVVPKAADVSTNDKAARRLTNVKFDAKLAGAIHGTDISGTISV